MTWLLADFALESTGVLVLCAGVVWVLRDHSAAVRHSAWFAGLVIVLALVPLSVVTPVFRLALYPQGIDAGSFLERGRPVAIAESPAAAMGPPGGLPVLVRQPTRPGTGTPSRWIAPVLPLVWLIGCLALLARIVWSRIGLGRLRRDARPIADPRIRASMDQVVRGMGPRTPVELLASEAVPTPVAFGVLRPTVMLPIDAGDWSAARLRVVLAHELSHLRRHDPWTHLLAEVARAVHWYNPLAWYAVDRLRYERERACDDEVVQDGSDAVDYADHLVSMARFLACPPKCAGDVLTWAGVMGLEARVSALLTPSLRRGRLTRLQRWMTAGLSIGILGALSVVSGSGPKAARAADRAIVRPTLVRERNAPLLAAESGTTPPSSPGRVAVEQTGGQAPGPEPEVRDGHAILDPPRDPLNDPLSERIELTTSPRLPSPEEIRSFKEGDFIARLVVAARHEKGFEHDLVRERAEWALARVEGGEIVAPLLASLEAGDWRVQSYAAWALATIGATRANPSLGRLLDHPNWRVRAQASSSLAVLGADVPIDVLAGLAKDPAWQVRMEAVDLLRRKDGTTGRSLLADMLDDPHAGTRMQVEAALAELDSR